jgi:hypothetical protein
MTELAGAGEDAAVEPAAEDQSAADAGGHRQIRHVLEAARGAEMPLRERRRVRVVLDEDRHAEGLLQHGAHRHVAPAGEVRRIQHHAALGIERARHRDADGVDIAPRHPCLAHQCLQRVDHRCEVVVAPAARRGRPALRGEHGAGGVAHGERDLGAADVDSQQRAHPKTSSGAQP